MYVYILATIASSASRPHTRRRAPVPVARASSAPLGPTFRRASCSGNRRNSSLADSPRSNWLDLSGGVESGARAAACEAWSRGRRLPDARHRGDPKAAPVCSPRARTATAPAVDAARSRMRWCPRGPDVVPAAPRLLARAGRGPRGARRPPPRPPTRRCGAPPRPRRPWPGRPRGAGRGPHGRPSRSSGPR